MTDPEFDPWEYYPGSRQRRRDPDVRPEPKQQDNAWDGHPVRKRVNGKEVEFFTIGAVAKALGKSVVTTRLWIRNGNLPQATFRLPDKKTPSGKTVQGRRLYTRAQIESLIEVAHRHGIIGSDRVIWSQHPTLAAEVREAWHNITA